MYRLLFFGFLLFGIGLPSLSQEEVNLSGYVFDRGNEEPLIGAVIFSGGKGTSTDANGFFRVPLEANQKHVIQVSYLGYRRVTLQWRATRDTQMIIAMEPESRFFEVVTVTSGKYERDLMETTASMEVLQPAFIQNNNATGIQQSLDKVGGVDFVGDQISIRGGNGYAYGAGSRVLVLVDDVPVLQPDAGSPNWNDYPLEQVGQVEILKGAASALYGTSALNGIVNIRTAYATEEPKTSASILYKMYMAPNEEERKWWDSAPYEYQISLSDRRRLGKFSLVSSVSYFNQESYLKENYSRFARAFLKADYFINDHLTAGITANLNKGKSQEFFWWQNGEAGVYLPAEGTLNRSERTRFFIDPYLKYFDDRNTHHFKSKFLFNNNPSSNNRDIKSQYIYAEYQYSRRLLGINAEWINGVVYNFTGSAAPLYGDSTINVSNVAFYSQWNHKIGDLQIEAGGRFENYQLSVPLNYLGFQIDDSPDQRLVFRVGGNYKLGKATHLRASWGQGYRYPTIAERFVSTSIGEAVQISPNPLLTPESGSTLDLGVRQGFQWQNWKGLFDISYFKSNYQNMMEFVFTGFIKGFQSQNVGDTKIQGVDMTLSTNLQNEKLQTDLVLSYTFVDPRFKEFTEIDSLRSSVDYNILKYRAKHKFKSDLQFTLPKWAFGFNYRYSTVIEAIDAFLEITIPGLKDFRSKQKNYHVLQLRGSYDINEQLTASLILDNVFNTVYSLRPGRLEAPRNLSLRINADF